MAGRRRISATSKLQQQLQAALDANDLAAAKEVQAQLDTLNGTGRSTDPNTISHPNDTPEEAARRLARHKEHRAKMDERWRGSVADVVDENDTFKIEDLEAARKRVSGS